MLALNRGEKEGFLKVNIAVDRQAAISEIEKIYIKGKNKIKLNSINKTDKQQEVEEIFAYYIKNDISTAAIAIQTHDSKFMQRGIGIKSLQKLEKYEVDILGNYHKVKLPEKRLPFNIKK